MCEYRLQSVWLLAVNFLLWVVEIGHGGTDEEGGHGGLFGFIFSGISPDLLGSAVILLGEWNHSFFRPTATARKPSYS